MVNYTIAFYFTVSVAVLLLVSNKKINSFYKPFP